MNFFIAPPSTGFLDAINVAPGDTPLHIIASFIAPAAGALAPRPTQGIQDLQDQCVAANVASGDVTDYRIIEYGVEFLFVSAIAGVTTIACGIAQDFKQNPIPQNRS